MHPHRVLVLFALIAACSNRKPELAPTLPLSTDVLAQVDDKIITTSDLESYIASRAPAARTQYTTPQARLNLLRQLVRFELMANEAERKGYATLPEIQRSLKREMVNLFLEREITQSNDVTAAEAEAYFRDHSQDFARDEVRIEHALFSQQDEAARAAAAIRTATRRAPLPSFQSLDFFDAGSTLYPRPVIQAALRLSQPNDVGGPIKSEQGFHVLRLIERHVSAVPKFSQVEARIRSRIVGERRDQAMDRWVAKLHAQAKVKTFEERLYGLPGQPANTRSLATRESEQH